MNEASGNCRPITKDLIFIIHVIGVLEAAENEGRTEKILEEVMAENVPNLAE